MGEFEDKLNSILSDPGQMEKISALASKLMGGGEAEEALPMAPDMMAKISGLLSGGDGDRTALLKAMEPYISPDRRERLKKAMKLAKAVSIAGALFSREGGEDG